MSETNTKFEYITVSGIDAANFKGQLGWRVVAMENGNYVLEREIKNKSLAGQRAR